MKAPNQEYPLTWPKEWPRSTPLDSDWPYEYSDNSKLRWCYPPAPPVK